MEDKEKVQYESIISDLRADKDKLINILDETLKREQEGNKATVQATKDIVESYNNKERNILITVIIVVGVLLGLIYIL